MSRRRPKLGAQKTGGLASRRKWLVALGIAALIVATYWQVTGNSFINYDDNLYVTSNPQVQAGLKWNGLAWAFSTTHTGNWIPLTWLSHMLDCQLYGLAPAGHHFTSLLVHIANATALLFLLQSLTTHLWRSAFVAAIFAVHPVNLESVAWVAERKNLLCTLLFLLTIWTYVQYAARPGWKRYLPLVIAFTMALMAKPMVVTLPFILVLLDYWPLGRLRLPGQPASDRAGRPATSDSEPASVLPVSRLLLEKVPLFLLALADSVITFRAQRESGSIGAVQAFPVSLRIENAFVSYSEYLQKLLWPSKLAIFYPYPHSHPPAWQIGLAALILFGVTLAVISVARRFKYSCTGWLWYLGTLIPVIGLVQVGGQSIADRYAYIPMLGILVLVGWGLGDLAQNRPRARKVIIASVLCLILVFAVVARTQVSLWADSESVFFHAQSVTQSNYVAYNNLGEALAIRGRTDDAALWFARAVQANPDYAPAQQNLGMALIQQGSLDDGIDHARKATELDPRSFDALNKLGAALAKKGELDEAVASLNRALEISPSFAPALANLASVLEQQGKFEEAAICFEKAAQNAGSPEMAAQFQYRLGNLLSRKGDTAQAAEHYRAALRLKPDLSPAIEALRRIPSQSR